MARIIDGTAKNLVGEQVRALRIKRGMSQQALSDKLETMAIYVCRGSVSRIEDRQRTVTDIELYGLSQVLGGAHLPALWSRRAIKKEPPTSIGTSGAPFYVIL